MDLQWTTSVPASAFHAAAARLRGRTLTDPVLQTALEPGLEMLREASAACGGDVQRVLDHLIPHSVEATSTHELVETALAKAFGRNRPPASTEDFSQAVEQVLEVFTQARPQAGEELSLRVEPLRTLWEARGPGLLALMQRMIDPNLLVPAARVVLLQPVLGGAGDAYAPYNSVTIEAMLANPLAQLPEVLRLGWLIGQLNFDLPAYTDVLNRQSLRLTGALGLIPAVLTVAEDIELARADEDSLRLACEAWLGKPQLIEVLLPWWETYIASQPTWPIALAALDAMLS